MAAMTMDMAGARGRISIDRLELIRERNHELLAKQARLRRGPIPEILLTRSIDNSRIQKAEDPIRKREMWLFAAAMGCIFVLSMTYVEQHYLSKHFGYQIEHQRAEVQRLQEENRHLRLTEAQLTEPARIDRMARQLGLEAPQPGQVVGVDGVPASYAAPVVASISQDSIH